MRYKVFLIAGLLISLISFVPAPHLNSVSWNMTEAVEGQPVRLNVVGTGLDGYEISFQIFERDAGGTDDIVIANPPNIFYVSPSSYTTWISEYQEDKDEGQSNPPEYYFNATVVGASNFMVSSTLDANMLKVYACGDGFCNLTFGENCATCLADCPCGAYERCGAGAICELYCGNGVCEVTEDCSTCPDDCGECINSAQLPFFGVVPLIITITMVGIIYLLYYMRKRKYKQKRRILYIRKRK